MVNFSPKLLDGYPYLLAGEESADTAVKKLQEAFSPQAVFDSGYRGLATLGASCWLGLDAYIGIGPNEFIDEEFGSRNQAFPFKVLVTRRASDTPCPEVLLCADGFFVDTEYRDLDLVVALDAISQEVYLAGELFNHGWPKRPGVFTLFTQLIAHPELRTAVLPKLLLEVEGAICKASPEIRLESSGLILVSNQAEEPTTAVLEERSICSVHELRDSICLLSIPTNQFAFDQPSARFTAKRVCEINFDF
ncbi:hypothetical protein ACNFIA_16700 [Pseudomonas sp. NY15437]|uniref:hypothetical protein n=1 Tax=Pseudomonas sp. NY15437 TaxID=3400360 RepID=UPI003A886082